MEIWQEIRKDQESGAKRLVSEYGDRLFAAAALLCRNDSDAEELVFRTPPASSQCNTRCVALC